jgi:hypothetical protein
VPPPHPLHVEAVLSGRDLRGDPLLPRAVPPVTVERGRAREVRNGVPVSPAYRWRDGDAARDAEVAAQLAAIRAEARRRHEAKQAPR